MNIDDVIYNKNIYPRDKIDQSKVDEYADYIGVLPPVEINQKNELIDGVHRYFAYKKAGQKVIIVSDTIIETKTDIEAKLISIEKNALHGLPLTQKEKRNLVIEYYQNHLENDNGFTPERLQQTFSIPSSTFSDWTNNLTEEHEAQRLSTILDLNLKCRTQIEISQEIGLDQSKISIRWKKTLEKFEEICRNPDSEYGIKYDFLKEKVSRLCHFEPKLYNIWNASSNNNEYKHFGNFPEEFMQNLLYYYTKPFDIVYDPFAGGGSTIDACKKMLRKYYATDLNPIELRDDIKKWDITKGIPKECPTPNFVFLDPPYWKQAENKYSNEETDLGNVTLERYYEIIDMIIKELKKKMKTGYVAFVISPTQWPNENHTFTDHIITIITLFEKHGFTEEIRYVLPYNTQQYNGSQVDISKHEKFPLNLIRDLVIFKKK